MKALTVASKKSWTSPDGEKSIWKVTLQTPDGKGYALETFSPAIGTVGWEGEAETYIGVRGDRMVRAAGDTAPVNGTNGGRTTTDQRIRAQWAITNAVSAATKTADDPDYFDEVTALAETFYDMACKLQTRGEN